MHSDEKNPFLFPRTKNIGGSVFFFIRYKHTQLFLYQVISIMETKNIFIYLFEMILALILWWIAVKPCLSCICVVGVLDDLDFFVSRSFMCSHFFHFTWSDGCTVMTDSHNLTRLVVPYSSSEILGPRLCLGSISGISYCKMLLHVLLYLYSAVWLVEMILR